MQWINILANSLQVQAWQVQNTIDLIADDKTIPFIARYRKEKTGELNEIQIREIFDEYNTQNKLTERKKEILQSLENQQVLTEELKKAVEHAESMKSLEEIYLPYKKKQKTRADVAVEKGLKPVSEWLLTTKIKNDDFVKKYINQEFELYNIDDVLLNSCDILAEELSYNTDIRDFVRENLLRNGIIETKKNDKVDDEREVYKGYYDNSFKVFSIPEWRVLAINRAEKEKKIKIKLVLDWNRFNPFLERKTGEIELEGLVLMLMKIAKIRDSHPYFELLNSMTKDSLKRLILPAIEREIRADLTERAENRSISIFQSNLRHLLLTPPLKKKSILAIDPGYRTGCKVAVIDENGVFLDNTNIYPTPPFKKIVEAGQILQKLVSKYSVKLIAIGNGTASRETEDFVSDFLKDYPELKYIIVSEAGASVYSASEAGLEEFPELDVTVRGAISIGRRVQDMLNELVKIPPESIGVGMYQHDISVNALKQKLSLETESVVNLLGVDINTASEYLLQYISGLSKKTARNIVEYRLENGLFKSRKELKKVKGIGEKTYEQAAGFCRVPESDNPLDNTIIHPESYQEAERIIKYSGFKLSDLKSNRKSLIDAFNKLEYKTIAKELTLAEILVKDIITAITEGLNDPRDEYPQMQLKSKVNSFESLYLGAQLEGIVRNITDFGIFIDIGVGHDGLAYRSTFQDYQQDLYYPGQLVTVEVINIDEKNKKSGLKLI
ncbi:MAG TPA: Tex-like N-terminal domain-containing protein [Candidatus Cloacimonadota bacterium]|nr:Tex-like N-terminal domain-containing protein [Candidatus Cloacimonadota bacterium]HQB40874.1 Tex-like N-terminal domain-containing protein [Candidatus Cloacimonadota bacterium]